MFLWLDDERRAPVCWAHAATFNEAVRLVKENEVTDMSLDHDFGETAYCGMPVANGMDFVQFMINNLPPAKWPRNINVHSHNNTAAQRMIKALEDSAPRFVIVKRIAWHANMLIKNGEVIK